MKIAFRYKGNKYFIVSWSFDCHLMEIQKEGGQIGRFIRYAEGNIKLSDFLRKLENINFS